MSLYTVIKVWSAGEILTAADLNTEFANDILNGPINHASQHASGAVDDIKAYFLSLAAGGTVAGAIALTSKLNEYKGGDIASATTTDIGAATGNLIDVTGAATITALGTIQAGTERVVRFTGTPTLTHNGTSLILPGAANIVCQANDIAMFRSLGSGNWVCTSYQRAVASPPNATPAANTVPVRRSTSPYAIDAAELAMTGEASAENSGVITLTAANNVEYVPLDLGTVTSGDRIWVESEVNALMGSASGTSTQKITKGSGTATIQSGHDNTEITRNFSVVAGETKRRRLSGILKVNGSGTLVLSARITSNGSDGSVAIGDGQIYAFFLKKQ